MPKFVRVLDMVLKQIAPWPFDVLVIDSGSSDGTVSYCAAHSAVRLKSIPPSDFGHGRTRNMAVSETDTPFVAFLTQDAQPCNTEWLAKLVTAVEQDDCIAGAFGRHIAWPEADPFTVRDIDAHFAGFLAHPLVVSRYTDTIKYATEETWRQFLHYYSDNNSCLRRSVWERFPYPDVDFAEDQLWARTVIAGGYKKAYAPDAAVFHSHDFRILERLQRSYDESRSFASYFGYRLSPTVLSAFRSIAGMGVRDARFALSQHENLIVPFLRRLLSNVMHVAGHYLGSHDNYIPTQLRAPLSRDKQLSLRE